MVKPATNNPVYVLGGSQTDFQRNWQREGKTFLAMIREVLGDALSALSIDYDEIARLRNDNRLVVSVGNFAGECFAQQGHLGAFLTEVDDSFHGVPGVRCEAACASGAAAIDHAATKIRAGDYDLALVLGIEMMKGVNSKTCGDVLGGAALYDIEARGIQHPFPKLFGELAAVFLRSRGIEEARLLDCLAEISRINYDNASRNPFAQTRMWYMSKDHALDRGSQFNGRVGGLLSVSDCSQITDGAAVVALASSRYLEEYASNRNPAGAVPVIKGWGHRVAPLRFAEKFPVVPSSKDCLLPWTERAVRDAYDRSGLNADRMDVFELHDCFTSSELALLSCVGIAAAGKEHIAVEQGLIARSGRRPVNPSGGLIGAGHPVGATGVRMLLDLYRQVTGQAGEQQVAGSRNGLMVNIGGTATTSYAFVLGVQD